jgi:hypothetical protein
VTRAVFALVAAVVGSYYLWGVRAAGYEFVWGRDLDGYYDYLGRAFTGGHLYLPIQPAPQLLAQPNPWDPRVDDSLKLFDAALFNGRYFLYHGAGPAVMLFTPWRLVTGHDLPENFGLFLLCFGGYLFSAGALLSIHRLAWVRPAPATLALLLLALGICQCVPFLLNRVWVYEVAIGGGYFCVSAALFFLLRGVESHRPHWLAAAGLMFGLAMACRPHLAIVGAVALSAMLFSSRRRDVFYLVTPVVLSGLAIAVYNYERFGNPLEFGNDYLLSGANQNRLTLSKANVAPGLYYLTCSAPEFSLVFPWISLPPRTRDFPRPATYIAESTTGAIYLTPFLPLVAMILIARPVRLLLGLLSLSGLLVLLFISETGWSTQRYEVDFLPLLVLACLAGFAVTIGRLGLYRRRALYAFLCLTIAFGLVVNLALGLAGPYDEMIANKPARFVRIAGWFSPIEKFRPVLNPKIDLTFRTAAGPADFRQDLFFAGRPPYRYELSIERAGAGLNLVSRFHQSTLMRETDDKDHSLSWRVTYSPESGEIHVNGDGRELLVHRIGTLVTAPAQIVIAPAGN